MSSSAPSAAAGNPYSEKPSVLANQGGSLIVPLDSLHEDGVAASGVDSAAVRVAARQLLPFNYGRKLEGEGKQIFNPVGFPHPSTIAAGTPAPPLFKELSIRGKPFLKNRIIVSPMCMYSSDGGFLNDFHLVHLGQFALGGAALVIVEATAVSPEGRISPTDSGIWLDAHVAPLKRITAFLHSQDSKAGIQLAHAGRKASTMPPFHLPRALPLAEAVRADVGGWPDQVIAPSAIPFANDYWTPREMTLDDIKRVKNDFAQATRRAVEAGFDYIEIHAAHGYLLTEFLCASSNTRTDEYGGSFANRTRLLLEIARETRAQFKGVLGVRISCVEWIEQGWDMKDSLALVKELESLGVDLIDCSSAGNSNQQKIVVKPGYQVEFAAEIKKNFPNIVVSAVGLITEAHQANDIIKEGKSDVVMIAREFLRAPHFPLEAAAALDYEVEYAPQYRRAKLSKGNAIPSGGPRS